MKSNLSIWTNAAIGTIMGKYQSSDGEVSVGNLSARLVSLILIAALLVPMFFFGEVQKVSADPLDSSMLAMVEPAPIMAAPEYYNIPGSLSLANIVNSPFDLFNWLFSSDETDTSESVIAPEPASVLTPPTVAQLSRERLNPKNATGGTNLYSRNFGWGTGLVGLSGRGVDAGFGISYNSLVWTKSGSEIVFNPDSSNVTPGFRFGYPDIEPNYTDPLTGANTYLMVSPSGGRTEFRLVAGTTDTFETADSSYAQIKVVNASTLVLYGTDGTQMLYTPQGGAFRCSQIKDANGNYITVNHDATGKLISVTDTLGRVITVNYDAQGQPTTITQPWQNGAHTYATFSYTNLTINTSFAGLSMVGVSNGMSVKVLQAITYADGSYTNFEYNTYGQVWRINNYAADTHKLNHVSVNLSAPAAGQTDCPRFTETRTYAENYNNGAEIAIPNLYQENVSFTPPGGSAMTGTLVQITAPDGTISKTYMMGSGWAEGLPLLSEDWSGGVRQRWSSSTFTQDNTGLSYILNPRVTESKVGDATNTRRTSVTYHAQYGLPNEVKVYDVDQTTVLKRSVTNYNLNTAYTSRRIIGMSSESLLYDGANNLMSRVTYQYDEGNFAGAGQTIVPIMWDGTNYGTGFIVGRGNPTSTTRWDATDPTNATKAVTSSVKYNTAGLPTNAFDPLGREIKTGYADSFEDNINRNTFAYPTNITDPANNTSYVKYRFDIGANAWAQSPAPAGQTIGKTTSRIYDALGRLEKEIVNNTGAYTRYEYPTNGVQARVFSTITDVNGNNTADTADEALSESFFDGAGRTRMSRTEHPGSVGGWSGTLVEYDIMGRTKRTSVPTEVNSSWTPAGDDATRGWLWNEQEYDWKGRVTRQINTDGTDKLISYAGCGCAGGMVTTIQSELVPRDDQPTVNARRTQKVYEDILGRSYKTETLNWNGTVYSTNKTFFNGRDQVTLARQYAGPDTSTTFQDTTMTFDGHGRLKTQHRPEQDAGTATVYNYNADDSLSSQIDARGATINYTYNNRRLITQISSTSPNPTTIPLSPTVTFTFDNIGNRTSMTDGIGNVTYQYDQLSRITAETRFISSSFIDAPQSANGFGLSYSYHLGGKLKSVTYPNGNTVNYNRDKTGREETITGQIDGQAKNLFTNIDYRSWGASKRVDFGNGNYWQMTYNNRLLPDVEQYYGIRYGGMTNTVDNKMTYYNDGRLKLVEDTSVGNIPPATNIRFYDRLQRYDFAGRLTVERSGKEAIGTAVAGDSIKYKYDITYDSFGNITSEYKPTAYSYTSNPFGIWTFTYTNNRNMGGTYSLSGTAPPWQYDADGRLTVGGFNSLPNSKYNSAGYLVNRGKNPSSSLGTTQEYWQDGDGQIVRLKEVSVSTTTTGGRNPQTITTTKTVLNHSIFSSILGEAVVFEDTDTVKTNEARTYIRNIKSHIFGLNQKVAVHQSQQSLLTPGSPYNWLDFEFQTSLGTKHVEAKYTSDSTNGMTTTETLSTQGLPVESIKFGTSTPRGTGTEERFNRPRSSSVDGDCTLDGVYVPCSMAYRAQNMGAAVQCPNNDCGPRVQTNTDGTRTLTSSFRAYADGFSGFIPTGYKYFGNGEVVPIITQRPTLGRATGQRQPSGTSGNNGSARGGPNDGGLGGNSESEYLLGLQQTGQQQKFFIVGFTKEQYNLLNDQLKYMANNEDCSKAFEDAGLKSVNSMIFNGGLNVFYNTLLESSTNNSSWNGNEEIRKGLLDFWRNATDVADATLNGPYENGMYYSSMSGAAFGGRIDTVDRVVVHSMIHAGGKRGEMPQIRYTKYILTGRPGPVAVTTALRNSKHDLDFFNYGKNEQGEYDESHYTGIYDKIMKACLPE